MTSKQKELLELLKTEKKHLTAEDIFLLAKSKDMNISLASVYRILNILVANKKLKRVSNVHKQDVYDVWLDDHEHLICSKCGKIRDTQIEDFKELLEKYTNVEIESYDLCVHYICDDCKKLGGE